jgi:hypothetical protein
MSGQIPRPMASIALVATLLVWGMGLGVPANTARADACLTAPNSPVPDGSHWYYHMDRAKQRKCWYIRASDQPEQHAAAQATSDSAATTPTAALRKPATDSPSAPMSISPGDGAAPPLPSVKPQRASKSNATTDELQKRAQKGSTAPLIKAATDPAGASMPTSSGDSTAPRVPSLEPQRAPLRGTITDQPVQQGARKGSPASSIAEAPAAQPSQSSQTSDQEAAPAPVARPVWPDPASTVKTEQPAAPPSEARPESNQPTVDARASDGAESTAQGDASFANAGMMASLTSTSISIFPVAALGLVVAGFLLRVVIRNSVARRQRIAVRQDFDWADDRPQHELPMINLSSNGTGSLTTYSAQVYRPQRISAQVAKTSGRTTHAVGVMPPGLQTKSASVNTSGSASIPVRPTGSATDADKNGATIKNRIGPLVRAMNSSTICRAHL